MKKILLSFLSLAMVALLVSCEEDTTGDISDLVYYPVITVSSGTQTDVVAPGADYAEPTATAATKGVTEDIVTTISSQGGSDVFDVNVPDIYYFTFESVNSAGYEAVVSKMIIVAELGDMVTGIEGVYTMDVSRVNPAETHTGLTYGIITKISDNLYEVSNAIGGFYSTGRAYGPDYAMAGMQIQVNDIATNDFAFPVQGIMPGPWAGDGPCEVLAAVVDPDEKSIAWTATWLGYEFNVKYIQVEP